MGEITTARIIKDRLISVGSPSKDIPNSSKMDIAINSTATIMNINFTVRIRLLPNRLVPRPYSSIVGASTIRLSPSINMIVMIHRETPITRVAASILIKMNGAPTKVDNIVGSQ